MEENEWGRQNTYTLDPEPPLKRSRPFTDNIIWVVIITLLLDIFVGGIASELLSAVLRRLASWSSAMTFIISYYTCILGSIIALFLILFLVKKNRFILRSFRPARAAGKPFKKRVAEDLFVLPNNNTLKMLLIGILLGFITNLYPVRTSAWGYQTGIRLQRGPAPSHHLRIGLGTVSERQRRVLVQRLYVFTS